MRIYSIKIDTLLAMEVHDIDSFLDDNRSKQIGEVETHFNCNRSGKEETGCYPDWFRLSEQDKLNLNNFINGYNLPEDEVIFLPINGTHSTKMRKNCPLFAGNVPDDLQMKNHNTGKGALTAYWSCGPIRKFE